MTDLVAQARSLFGGGKGILAADESVHTATKRLADFGIPTSAEMRRLYRELFFGTPGIEEYLSGIILFADCLEEKGNDGKRFQTMGLHRPRNKSCRRTRCQPLGTDEARLIP
jgi:fructose-bisphosphate aldolase class I